jgi:pyruvate formate lyase activating enzyme
VGPRVWVEVTTLIIPGYNDSEEKLKDSMGFLASVSIDMPWHVSAFNPMYKMKDVLSTSWETLRKGVKIGRGAGLRYIYVGNMPGENEDTICPVCGELLVERLGYRIMKNTVAESRCPKCSTTVAGVWSCQYL